MAGGNMNGTVPLCKKDFAGGGSCGMMKCKGFQK